jgi:hypothetical protein
MTLEQLREELGPAAYDDLVEGVRCQAESDVALLIEAIDRNNGSVRRTTPNPTAKSQPSPTPLVLAMVAALRVQRWYEEGHLQSFANGPPDPASLIPIVERSAKGTLNEADAVAAKRFAVSVLVFWTKHFSWKARRLLGVDVALRQPQTLVSQLDALAEYLFEHSRLVSRQEGDENGDS